MKRVTFLILALNFLTFGIHADVVESEEVLKLERVEYLEKNYMSLLGLFDDLAKCTDVNCRTKTVEKYMPMIDWTSVNIGGLNALREAKIHAIKFELAKVHAKATGKSAERKKYLLQKLKKIEAEPEID